MSSYATPKSEPRVCASTSPRSKPLIDTEDLDSNFEPFWRKEGSYIRRQNGTGLGLSLTRQLIERLGEAKKRAA